MASCSVTTLLSSGKDFQKLSKRELQICICQLLCNISSGGAISSSFGAGDYSGGVPTFTPPGTFGEARDTVTGRLWIYDSTNGWS